MALFYRFSIVFYLVAFKVKMKLSKLQKIVLTSLSGIILLMFLAGFWGYQHREQLLKWILAGIHKNLNGKLSVKSIEFSPLADFSGATFSLKGVSLQDTAFEKHHIPFAEIETINVTIDWRKLLQRKFLLHDVVLEEGNINVFIQKNGYSNLSIFNPKADSKPQNSKENSKSFFDDFFSELQSADFNNINCSYIDSLGQKRIVFRLEAVENEISNLKTTWKSHWEGKVYIDGLSLDTSDGTYLEKKATQMDFYLAYDTQSKVLSLSPSSFQVEQDIFKLNGGVAFSATKDLMHLNVQTDTIALSRALTILTKPLDKTIRDVGILPIVKANVELVARLDTGGLPLVKVDFQTDTFNFKSPIGMLSRLKAKGVYFNQIDSTQITSDANSKIQISELTGFLFGTIPLKSALTIKNMDTPSLTMQGVFDTELIKCSSLFDDSEFQFRAGRGTVSFQYDGAMDPIFDEKKQRLNGKLSGRVVVREGGFRYVPQQLDITHLNTDIIFDESRILLPYLHFNHYKNKIRMSGKFVGLLPYIFNSEGKVNTEFAIFTPDLGLDWVTKLHGPKPDKHRKKKHFSAIIDKAFSHLETNVVVMADQIRFRKFRANKVKGKLFLSDRALSFKNVKMQAFGGSFNLSGGIDAFNKKVHQLYANGDIANANVTKVFEQFDNFKQTTITNKHLSGVLSTNFDFKAQMKDDFEVIPSSMSGKLDLHLANGELTNFPPLKNLQLPIFKHRDFNNVRFASIDNVFTLRGQDIDIAKMAVESSVITFFIDGVYSFNHNTNLTVQIPLSNLKRRNKDYELAKQDLTKIKGPNIFLKAIDENGQIKIKYDLFHRFKK